jgi:serine/threonine-protein kinase ATR
MSDNTRICFAQLNNADRCKSMEYLGQVPCASSGSLTVVHGQAGTIRSLKCAICEGASLTTLTTERPNERVSREAILTFSKLISSSAFLDSRRPRVMAMIALRKFAVHSTDPAFVNLETSSLGQWCLQSLQSSIRELRVAAG